MIKDIKSVIARSHRTLLADALGAVAIMTMLVGFLHIPSLT